MTISEGQIKKTTDLLGNYGVTTDDLVAVAHAGQSRYYPELTIDTARRALDIVLSDSELYRILLVCEFIDNAAQQGIIPGELQELVASDDGLFGVDENLGQVAAMSFGSIAGAEFGHLDKTKPGIIGVINDAQKEGGKVSTMMDDMVCAIIAATEGKIAKKFGR